MVCGVPGSLAIISGASSEIQASLCEGEGSGVRSAQVGVARSVYWIFGVEAESENPVSSRYITLCHPHPLSTFLFKNCCHPLGDLKLRCLVFDWDSYPISEMKVPDGTRQSAVVASLMDRTACDL